MYFQGCFKAKQNSVQERRVTLVTDTQVSILSPKDITDISGIFFYVNIFIKYSNVLNELLKIMNRTVILKTKTLCGT